MAFRAAREPWGPRAISSIERQINTKPPVTTVTASRTIKADAGFLLVDATAGAVTITLPPAREAIGFVITVLKTDAGGNAVTIDGSGAETINGAATKSTTTQWAGWAITSNGAAWFVSP